jgi:hypothetical protein
MVEENHYRKYMKKIFILSFALAGIVLGAGSAEAITTANLSCVKSAVEKRETVLATAISTHASAIESALSARKSALVAAWGIAERVPRRNAIKSAWKAFKTSAKSAHHDARTAKNTAWRTFNADVKACGGETSAVAASDENDTEKSDNVIE